MFDYYKDFCFSKIETVSQMRDKSELEFRSYWASEVAHEFGLVESDISKLFIQESTSRETMDMWSYGITSGVTVLPSARING